MQLTTVGTVIASREFALTDGKTVTIEIGKPEEFPDDGGYYCPFKITGMLSDKIRYAGGVDSVQALELGLKMIGSLLVTSEEAKSGKLVWEAAPRKGDFGFPVPDILRDLAP